MSGENYLAASIADQYQDWLAIVLNLLSGRSSVARSLKEIIALDVQANI